LEDIIKDVLEGHKPISINKCKEYGSLTLAFVGDAVYTLFIRTKLTQEHNIQAGKLHTLTNAFVKASGQSNALEHIIGSLSEDEHAVANRARNVKNKTTAKNATVADYNRSTSLEALVGYLYLTGQTDRLIEILEKCYEETK